MIPHVLSRLTTWLDWQSDEEGATAVEYGIMLAAIAAVIILVALAVGNQVSTEFTDFNADFQQVT